MGIKAYRIDEDGCWRWLGSLSHNGYAQTTIHGRPWRVARFMYELEKGPIAAGLEIDHLCREPACVNPEHLEAVTHAENIRRKPATKLTFGIIEKIKEYAKSGMKQWPIARKFGMNQSEVSRILAGKAWNKP